MGEEGASRRSPSPSAGNGLRPVKKPRWRQKQCWYMLLGLIACVTLLRVLFSGTSTNARKHLARVARARPHMLPIFDKDFSAEIGELPIEEVHRKGLPHFGVVVLTYRRRQVVAGADEGGHGGAGDVEILFTKRSASVQVCPKQWLLVGEHAQRQEDAVTMALRGLREELGVFAAEEDVTHLCDMPIQHQFNDGRQENQMTHLAMVNFPSFQQIDLDMETKETRWFSPAEAVSMAEKNNLCGAALSQTVRRIIMTACQRLREVEHLDCGIEIDAGAFACPREEWGQESKRGNAPRAPADGSAQLPPSTHRQPSHNEQQQPAQQQP